MGCPDSILARPNSRIFSTLLAMTQPNRHSPNHVAGAPNVCYRIWDTFAIVRLILPFLIASHAGVADEFAAFFFFLFMVFFLLCIVNSMVLLTNGISFAIQAVLLLMIGAWADYGTWRCAGAEPSRGGSMNTRLSRSETGRIS